MNILFINEFDLNRNNSAGITVRDLFGEEICNNSMQVSIISGNIIIKKKERILYKSCLNICSVNTSISLINEEQADIIYTTGNSPKMLSYLLAIKHRTRIPIIFHYFDNWRETKRAFLKNLLLKLINGNHEVAFVISDPMNNHYKKKYHGSYTTLMVGSGKPIERKKRKQNEFVFMYAGGFHLGRGEALARFESILKKTAENCRLEIITFKSDYQRFHERFDENYTSFIIDVNHSDIQQYYEHADALLFVEPAPDNSLCFLKYSMSTKIPEYLASGLPIICISIDGVAPYEYFKTTQSAYLATNEEDTQKCIQWIIQSPIENKRIIDNARLAVARDFDRTKQREILFHVLSDRCNQANKAKKKETTG